MNNVTFTRVKIFRNIKDFKFMRKLEQEKRDEIIKLVSTALKDKLAFMDNNSDISQLIKYRLVENNSYVFKSKNGDVCVNLFAGEHITIISSDFGFNLYTSSCS